MISQHTVDAINASTRIEEVIGEFVKLKREGIHLKACCPFHKEKTPSFTVTPNKNLYKCFGCGKSGDAIQFLIDHQEWSYVQAMEYLAKLYNIPVEQSIKREYVKPPERLTKLNEKALSWFEQERKISNYTLLKFKITEGREFMPQLKQEVTVICFNYFRNGQLVNIKHRGPSKSFKLEKDAELILYNLDSLKGETEAVITEGEIDVMSWDEAGIHNVVGVPNGTTPTGSRVNLEYLDNSWDDIKHIEKWIIAVDNDSVGQYLKEELGRRFGKEKCFVVTYPEGRKDTNEVLIHEGKDAVKAMYENARPWPLEGIVEPDDIWPLVEKYYEEGFPPGAASGFPGMDEMLTFLPGHLTMVTGIPGHGKDEVTNELAVALAKRQGWKWGIFNFEEPPEIHATKLIEKYNQKAFAFRKDPEHRVSRAGMEKGMVFVADHFKFVKVNTIDVTMEGILKKAGELVNRFGIKGLIINPWNYLEHKRDGGQSETEYVSEVLTMLCNFLWKHGVHCYLIAHPTKMQKDKRTGKLEVPTLYSINGSSHFYNKTHNGLCVYRHFDTGQSEVIVQKVKWYWLGNTGSIMYGFDTNLRQYYLQDVQRFGAGSSVNSSSSQFPPLPEGNWTKLNDADRFIEPVKAEPEDLPF